MLKADYSPQQQHYEAQIALRMIDLELARRRMLDFCQITKSDWITARHHVRLCEIADRAIAHQVRFVAVSLPPRHTKSEIFSIRLPAMYLGVHPDRHIIHVSYAAALSNTFSMQVRSLIRDDETYHELFPATQIDPDRQRLDDWKTTLGGGFKSIGVGAGISGHGADLIICDDVTKEGDENSPQTLRQTFEWYASAARIRLSPGGVMLLIGTRWALGDLIGAVLDSAKANPHGDQWEAVVLPALAGENDPLGRGEGEALWPERFSVNDLLAIQSLSKRYFQSLYQQDPQPEGAKLFYEKWFTRLYESNLGSCVWAFDLAISEDNTADFTVWGRWVFDREKKSLSVGDIERVQQQWPETKKDILNLMDAYPDDLFLFPKDVYELMAVQELRSSRSNDARRIRQVSMKGDKRERAGLYAQIAESGRASVQEGTMGDLFIREHDRFPDEHDDFVDMSSVAAHYFAPLADFKAIIRGESVQKAQEMSIEEMLALIGEQNGFPT